MKYYVPIFSTSWNEPAIKITKYLTLGDERPNIEAIKKLKYLSDFHLREVSNCRTWLIIDEAKAPKKVALGAIVNIFLLSIWMNGPTRGQAKYIFGSDNQITILYDRFHFTEGEVGIYLSKDVMLKCIINFKLLMQILKKQKRLATALLNTNFACMSASWKVALICYSAAIEALLTYSKARGLTKRLAKSFACLTKNTRRERGLAYRRFIKQYAIRSDIMHGRPKYFRDSEANKKT